MILQGVQILKSVYAGKIAGIDNAHEQISDVRAVQSLEKQRVFAVQDSFFQHYFANFMPTSELCRVVESGPVFERIFRPPAIAHAA